MAPRAMADKLVEIVENPDAVKHAAKIAKSVADTKWADPGETFIQAFEKVMIAGA
jgi:hypothetical protein